MATPVTYTVVEDGSGDYTTVAAAENAQQRDITASDEIVTIEIQDSWTSAETTQFSISGWTTDDTRYVIIQAVGDARHDGKWTETAWRIETTDISCVQIGEFYCQIHGLQAKLDQSIATDRYAFSTTTAGDHSFFRHCIGVVESTSVNADCAAFYENCSNASQANPHFQYCLAYHVGAVVSDAHGFQFNLAYGAVGFHAEGCTAIGFPNKGFYVDATHKLSNCLASGNGEDFNAVLSATSRNCASGDASLSGGSDHRASQTFTFVDAANRDYRLASTDAGAKGYGYDDTGTYGTDLAGETRTAPTDIGALNYYAPPAGGGGGGAPTDTLTVLDVLTIV